MELKNYKLYHGNTLMQWGKATRVKGAKGFAFIAGCEGIDPTLDPPDFRAGEKFAPKVVEGAEAQWKLALEKVKSRLEEAGTSLDNVVHMTIYVAGPFPDGVVNSPNFRPDVMEEFFREHCPKLCDTNNPPTHDLVGVASLALKEMVVEIGCIAALPD